MSDTRNERFLLRNIAGTHFLLDTQYRGKQYKRPLQINDMGAEIFDMWEKGMARAEIIQSIAREYGIEEDIIANDLQDFFGQLRDFDLEI